MQIVFGGMRTGGLKSAKTELSGSPQLLLQAPAHNRQAFTLLYKLSRLQQAKARTTQSVFRRFKIFWQA